MLFCQSAEPYLEMHGHSAADIASLCEALSALGAGALNLSWGPDSESDAYSMAFASAMSRSLGEHGLAVSFHLPMSTDISSVDEAERAAGVALQARNMRAIGKRFPGAICVIHPEPGNPRRVPGDGPRRIELCQASMAELADVAIAHDVRLALENMRSRPDNLDRTGMFTDQLGDIVAPVDATAVGICFDAGHAFISEGTNMYDAFARNASRINHIHLADNSGLDDEHLMPGEGGIDFCRFFAIVRASGYSGLAHIEVKPLAGEDPLAFYKRGMNACRRLAGI